MGHPDLSSRFSRPRSLILRIWLCKAILTPCVHLAKVIEESGLGRSQLHNHLLQDTIGWDPHPQLAILLWLLYWAHHSFCASSKFHRAFTVSMSRFLGYVMVPNIADISLYTNVCSCASAMPTRHHQAPMRQLLQSFSTHASGGRAEIATTRLPKEGGNPWKSRPDSILKHFCDTTSVKPGCQCHSATVVAPTSPAHNSQPSWEIPDTNNHHYESRMLRRLTRLVISYEPHATVAFPLLPR